MAKRRHKGRKKKIAPSAKPPAPPTPPAQGPVEPPPPARKAVDEGGRPHLFYALWGILAVATVVALYLVYHKARIALDPNYVSSCNFGGSLNCDAVNASKWSEMFGLPIALFGIPTYVTWAFLAWRARAGLASGSQPQRTKGLAAIEMAAFIGACTVIYSVFLGFISTFSVGAYCLYCISLYLLNIAGTVVTLAISPRGTLDTLRGAVSSAMNNAPPLGATIGVLAASFLVAWAGYHELNSNMEEAYLRAVDEQLSTSPTSAGQVDPVSASDGSVEQAGATPIASESSSHGRRGGQQTASGWSYFEPTLNEAFEFWAGNPEATVTLVEYADFQCAYCRRLGTELAAIKKDYGDRIRLLMKHFPMNEACNPQARGYDKHPLACELAYAAHCAGLQGRFWEMHDLLFENQSSLNANSAAEFASQLGLDLSSFDVCVQSSDTRAKIEADVASGRYAGFNGTPRLYVNGHLISGSRSKRIIEYYIEKALEEGSQESPEPAVVARSPRPAGGEMIAATTSAGAFYIDPYECAIDVEGRAVSKPGVPPAFADYFMAREACEKAGKRICTEEEWLSACTGVAAVDNNGNGLISDDVLEGNLYPYGPYYLERACHDDADPLSGTPDDTGSWERCRTPSGIHDMTGNIGEWVDGDHGKPLSVGGAMSTRNAECSRRYKAKPPHTRNRSTGFRCCADSPVQSDPDVALLENEESVLSRPAPVIEASDKDGNPVKIDDFEGQVTLINFFASWCAPCRREFPHLVDYVDKYESRGLRIVGVGVDTNAASSIRFAEQFNANFLVLTDPENRVKGDYLVYTMPATFLVDRDGVIRYQFVGFTGADQEAEFRRVIEELL